MNEWLNIFFDSSDTNFVLIGLALIAALAQTASSETPSLKILLVSIPMSLFAMWMAWLGMGHLGFSEKMQIFWSGIAAFGAPWILRGINTMLHEFVNSPIETLERVRHFLRKK
ncbi:hypothetical protein [Aeromonas jandaei]|uniref:hypothetical protein n=1 Tax=Aeromonas jandaei TaxID=650 RepID=UPI003BA06CA9